MHNGFSKADKMTDGPTSYFIAGDDELKEAVQKNHSVSTVPAPPKSKLEKLIYFQLEQYCDFIFCQKAEEYFFYSKEQFNIFARDKSGGCYGFIGGIGDIQDDSCPVAYVSPEGKSGKIANSLKDLLCLIINYPFWRNLLKHYNDDIQEIIEVLEKERVNERSDYCKVRQDLANDLALNRNEYTIENLFACLSEEPRFIVYSSEDDSPSENLLS